MKNDIMKERKLGEYDYLYYKSISVNGLIIVVGVQSDELFLAYRPDPPDGVLNNPLNRLTFIKVNENDNEIFDLSHNLGNIFFDAKPEYYYQYIQQILDPSIQEDFKPGLWGGFGGEMYNDRQTGGFYWTAVDGIYEGNLTHSDGINLFYNYFKAFEIYVDEYLDSSYQEKEWYKLFKQELPNLEKVYKDLVKKGEIVEVDIEKE